MGKTLFMDKKKLLTGKLNFEQKKWIIKSTVWNVALYAAETWTLTKANKQLLEAFEMWTWQRMLKISLTEKVTNKEVLVHANEARSILKMIWHSEYRWLAHVLRHDNFLHDITEGKTLDKATRGRQRMELWYDGRERLLTVERFNLRQMKMETGQQVRVHFRNLLETTED